MMDIERAAARLRRYLSLAPLPELRLFCGLRFFGSIDSAATPGLESYVREFTAALAEAARKCNPREFLPEDGESLAKFVELLKTQKDGVVSPDDLKTWSDYMNRLALPRTTNRQLMLAKSIFPV